MSLIDFAFKRKFNFALTEIRSNAKIGEILQTNLDRLLHRNGIKCLDMTKISFERMPERKDWWWSTIKCLSLHKIETPLTPTEGAAGTSAV